MKYQKISDFIKEELRKNKHKEYLEISMILEQISKEKNIISFDYKKPYLLVRVGYKDYYKIELKEVN